MENLFDFSPSAPFLHIITHKVVKCFVKHNQTDAILDIKEMYNTLYKGYPVYMCVRENGFDTIKRYSSLNVDVLKKYKGRGNFEVINNEEFELLRKEVERSLGADAYIKVYPNEAKIDVIFNKEFSESELKNIKYELLGIEPMVSVNFVEKFGM
jgi:hypothetical protein